MNFPAVNRCTQISEPPYWVSALTVWRASIDNACTVCVLAVRWCVICDEPSAIQSPVKGTVTDRPWGVTLAALALDGRTGQLTLRADGRAYRIVFLRGAIVGATSPLAVDSPVRVALTSRLITAVESAELEPRLRARANRPARGNGPRDPDEIDLIAEAAGLAADHADRFRAAVLTRCAARTFAVDHGHYVLEDRIGEVGVEGDIDVRAVVYLGARLNLSDQRLAYDLRQFGSWFLLRPPAVTAPRRIDDVSGFGFGDVEAPILEDLRLGTNLAAIEARHREIDPRTAQAVIYALAACDAVVRCEPPAMASTEEPAPATSPTISRIPTRRQPEVSRVPTPREPTVSRLLTRRPAISSQDATSPWGVPTTSHASGVPVEPIEHAANESGFVEARATTVRPNALTAGEVKALIAARYSLLEHGADYFALLGLPYGAAIADVHAAYVELARYLEPKRLALLGIADDACTARQLFAQICIAVTVLTDTTRRCDYMTVARPAGAGVSSPRGGDPSKSTG